MQVHYRIGTETNVRDEKWSYEASNVPRAFPIKWSAIGDPQLHLVMMQTPAALSTLASTADKKYSNQKNKYDNSQESLITYKPLQIAY